MFILCDQQNEYLKGYCLNKGTCYSLVNRNKPMDYTKRINIVVSDLYCHCMPEYTGNRCEVKLGKIFLLRLQNFRRLLLI